MITQHFVYYEVSLWDSRLALRVVLLHGGWVADREYLISSRRLSTLPPHTTSTHHPQPTSSPFHHHNVFITLGIVFTLSTAYKDVFMFFYFAPLNCITLFLLQIIYLYVGFCGMTLLITFYTVNYWFSVKTVQEEIKI